VEGGGFSVKVREGALQFRELEVKSLLQETAGHAFATG
jgi:hypothetical protein